MPTVNPPHARDEIVAALRKLHDESGEYWNAFSTDAFLRPLGQAWSPADHVRHLTKSIRPVAQALRLPRLALRVAFGAPRQPSRTYAQVVEAYHAALSGGVQSGRFAPSQRPAPADPDAWRREIMAQRDAVAASLADALAGWSDRALDHARMPHPALGKLTVREMAFFTLYHNLHHVHVAERRRSEAEAGAPAPGPA